MAHTGYSESSTYEFNTDMIPGYYRVVGFVKFDGVVVQAKSPLLFAHPVEITSGCLPEKGCGISCMLRAKYWSFPALYFPGQSSALFVMLPGALDRKAITLPYFNRWMWAHRGLFPGSVLCVADPTLERNSALRLGWFLGSETHDATEELACLIANFAECKGVARDEIVFWGSSAGGFAALALAASVDGSLAVAINAQTDCLAYLASQQVALVRQACFGDMSADRIRHGFARRVDMTSRWSDVCNSRVFLVQNDLDAHHYKAHFIPFWASLGGEPVYGLSRFGRHTSWIYSDKGGHGPETFEMAQKIIETLGISSERDHAG
ncbi:hypothetical protein [Nitratidesulfovibrio termitidis]|uniref:hypothetical protein n=1 Tax=Nitratidesulfovibrio termitidis TaxID=42252 RepID=UPI0012EB404A|nr:hypothetical protein [Nitratidesulfovibrio termitidis]